jgi:outer membrane protein assembly factor BamD
MSNKLLFMKNKLAQKIILTFRTGLFVTSLCAGLSACSTADKIDTSTPEGAYKLAEEFEKDERYEEAIQKFADIKNKNPYSRFAAMSELKIADLQYKRESYIEAQNAYQLFKDFHPKHPQVDYVTFRLAMSYFNQLPSSIDRDLSVAEKSILYFDEVINSYPSSTYVVDAKQHRTEALKMKAEKELYIARFYLKREKYDSALKRFEGILDKFPGLGFEPVALFGAAKCAFENGEKEKANQFYKSLKTLYPGSNEAKQSESEFRKYGAN